VALAIAVDGKEVAGDAKEKTITVTLKDGNVLVNGKPVKIPAIKAVKSGKTFQVQPMPALKADAELVKRLKNIENELKEIRKLLEEMKQEDADD
jgi:ribosomal protein S4